MCMLIVGSSRCSVKAIVLVFKLGIQCYKLRCSGLEGHLL